MAKTPEKNDDSPAGAVRGAAVRRAEGPIHPDPAAVVDAWPSLPEAIKAGILAMIRTAE